MKKPNILYILVDDMGYGDLSCLNEHSKIRTRNLDRLAANGMSFTDAHSSSAVCTPSRYSILTGRYNWRSWLKRGVTDGYDRPLIESDRMTVASCLREQGYATACIGKWHLGWDWARGEDGTVDYTQPISGGPTDVGFDEFFGISGSLDMPPYVYLKNEYVTAAPDRVTPDSPAPAFWREGPIAPNFAHEEVMPAFTRKAIRYIEEKSAGEQPFFLYFSLPAPHTPILPRPEFQGKSGTNAYGDFCLDVDDVVGQVMDALERCGVAEDTIVVFTSDNGCSPQANFEELATAGHNPSYIFRGHKADIYEGGHRIPLLVRWPRRIASGATCGETICLVDFLATCTDILGVTLPGGAGEDSVSNLPLWEGKPLDGSLREATVHHSIDGSFSIRYGQWKLEMCAGSGGWSDPKPGSDCEGLPPVQLYDLQSDIGERRNVYAENPVVIDRLRALLTQYVENGRSTPGPKCENTNGTAWEQLWWMHPDTSNNC
ncbi:arylsulfatase [Ruficoccus sp. ZRK36]|uniref:sulfatase family protein n=1 Tax=Ruficoccus sp. ZRK36 TaxID=2866311 RepID=UPI001C72FC87|nr:arylsulfatase [Ruficoccus sp. ZRK36]QYY36045.1 arylsulfatase [Ruficoccus sp. ZRK36]